MSYFKETKKNTPTRSKEDLADQEIKRICSFFLNCTCLYMDTKIASIELSFILLEIIKNEASKEDGDTRLALMAHNYLNWIKDVTDKLNEVLSRVEAGTFPIADANELFIKAYKKFKEVELDVKSLS